MTTPQSSPDQARWPNRPNRPNRQDRRRFRLLVSALSARSPWHSSHPEHFITIAGALLAALAFCASGCRVPQSGAQRRTRDPEAAFADAGPQLPRSCDEQRCTAPAECELIADVATCVCPAGYVTDESNPSTCTDIDECETGDHDCDENAACMNRTGGFDCFCNDGYTGNGRQCRSLSDCGGAANTCHADAECSRTDDGVSCACTQGFTGDGQVCVDIDECAEDTAVCPDNASCRNLRSGYECSCDPTFEGDPRMACRDACISAQSDSTRCDPRGHGRCTFDPEGTAVCLSCLSDSVGDGKQCTVTTECSTLGCGDNTVCAGAEGERRCECAPGFSGDALSAAAANEGCSDIDECEQQQDSCDRQQTDCRNTEGGYICVCKPGTQRVDGSTECTDIDECDRGWDLCDSSAICTNSEPGYACECKPGFVGDGYACQDVDECEQGSAGCIDDGIALCQNTRGGYECVCPSGYLGDASQEPCYCDLSGYWGVRQQATLELPERRAGNVVLIDQTITRATIWELHRYTYDGEAIRVDKLQCGSDKVPEIYSPLYQETYSSRVPNEIYAAMPYTRTSDIPLNKREALPGKPFVTPRDALVRGIRMDDPVNDPWPESYADVPNDRWDDPDNDGEPGLTLWPGQTNALTSDGEGTFSYLPVALQGDSTRIATRAGCVSTAVRAIGHLEGTLTSCSRIVGKVINDKTEGRVHSCTQLRMADWDTLDITCRKADWQEARKCTDVQIEFLDDQDQTSNATADFESVKLGELSATDIDCAAVRSALPAL